jgi:hypothetical protein
VLHPNTWYHVAGTAFSSKSASIYLNGALMKTGVITQTILARPREPLHTGVLIYYGVPSYRFNGMIDGVTYIERALSADEIRRRYLAGLPKHKN